jgi:hypothetical protein
MSEHIIKGHLVLVDDEDDHIIADHTWCVIRTIGGDREYYYVIRSNYINKGYRQVRLHRQLLDAPKGVLVDHINHNTLDNRRCNLRLCSIAENRFNSQKVKSASSSYKGVRWVTTNKLNPWEARISLSGSRKVLGYFPTEEAAASAYDIAAHQLFGTFAMVNF